MCSVDAIRFSLRFFVSGQQLAQSSFFTSAIAPDSATGCLRTWAGVAVYLFNSLPGML